MPSRVGFLKCYYGYKNFGDELLLFGVLQKIQELQRIDHLIIEVGDKIWMDHRLTSNTALFAFCSFTIQTVQRGLYPKSLICNTVKFFGGGEVINDQDKYVGKNILKKIFFAFFARSGRNYLLQYPKDFFWWEVYMLGGIGKIYKRTSRLLYALIFPRIAHAFLRDEDSCNIIQHYTPNYTQVDDFSTPVIQQYKQTHPQTKVQDKYILINASSHVNIQSYIHKLETFVHKYPKHKIIFFACDMRDDIYVYHQLHKKYKKMSLYDWTQYPLTNTLDVLAGAQAAMGSRLHFLYPLKLLDIPLDPIIYKDKVRKLIID